MTAFIEYALCVSVLANVATAAYAALSRWEVRQADREARYYHRQWLQLRAKQFR